MKKKVLGLITLMLTMLLLCVPVAAEEGDSPATGGGAGAGGGQQTTTDITIKETDAYKVKVYMGKVYVSVLKNDALKDNINEIVSALKAANKKADNWYIGATVPKISKAESTAIKSVSVDDVGIQVVKLGDSYKPSQRYSMTGIEADKEYNFEIKLENNATVTKKLSDAKISKSFQYKVMQNGFYASRVSLYTEDLTGPSEAVIFEHKYVYRYDEAQDVFEFVDDSCYLSGAGTSFGISVDAYQGGSYVIVESFLPESLTGKKTTVVDTSSATTSAELKTAIATTIASLTVKAGEVVKVEVPKGLSVSSDIFKAAKEKGIGLDFVSTAGTPVKWQFAEIAGAVDFDPEVNTGVEIEKVDDLAATYVKQNVGMKYETVSFAYDGDLPGKAEVQLDLSTCGFKDGTTVYLMFYNPKTNKFEKTGSATYKAGVATFTMTHCSDYIVTDVDIVGDSAGKMGDSRSIVSAIMIMLVGATLLAAVIIFRKRRI